MKAIIIIYSPGWPQTQLPVLASQTLESRAYVTSSNFLPALLTVHILSCHQAFVYAVLTSERLLLSPFLLTGQVQEPQLSGELPVLLHPSTGL